MSVSFIFDYIKLGYSWFSAYIGEKLLESVIITENKWTCTTKTLVASNNVVA